MQGGLFTDRYTSKVLFLPAVGSRYETNGNLYNYHTLGAYWSSAQSDSLHAYSLNFGNGGVGRHNYSRTYGLAVRCVRE